LLALPGAPAVFAIVVQYSYDPTVLLIEATIAFNRVLAVFFSGLRLFAGLREAGRQ
jgi:hypothetical protein